MSDAKLAVLAKEIEYLKEVQEKLQSTLELQTKELADIKQTLASIKPWTTIVQHVITAITTAIALWAWNKGH